MSDIEQKKEILNACFSYLFVVDMLRWYARRDIVQVPAFSPLHWETLRQIISIYTCPFKTRIYVLLCFCFVLFLFFVGLDKSVLSSLVMYILRIDTVYIYVCQLPDGNRHPHLCVYTMGEKWLAPKRKKKKKRRSVYAGRTCFWRMWPRYVYLIRIAWKREQPSGYISAQKGSIVYSTVFLYL